MRFFLTGNGILIVSARKFLKSREGAVALSAGKFSPVMQIFLCSLTVKIIIF